jgi:hypothetical protein
LKPPNIFKIKVLLQISGWIARVVEGQILFEMDGMSLLDAQ